MPVTVHGKRVAAVDCRGNALLIQSPLDDKAAISYTQQWRRREKRKQWTQLKHNWEGRCREAEESDTERCEDGFQREERVAWKDGGKTMRERNGVKRKALKWKNPEVMSPYVDLHMYVWCQSWSMKLWQQLSGIDAQSAHTQQVNKHTNSPSIEHTHTLTTSTRAATCKQLKQTCQNSLIRTWDVFKAKADRHEWTCAKCHLGNAALHTFVLFTSTSTYKQTINREANYWTPSRGEEREERSELTEGQKENRAC